MRAVLDPSGSTVGVVELGTLPDWLSLVVNGAVAVAALLGLTHARRDTARAEERAAAAQRELADDRRRREVANLARLDFENLYAILQLHGARTSKNIWLAPIEYGRIRAALAALPPDVAPLARSNYEAGHPGPAAPLEDVTAELCAALTDARTKSISAV